MGGRKGRKTGQVKAGQLLALAFGGVILISGCEERAVSDLPPPPGSQAARGQQDRPDDAPTNAKDPAGGAVAQKSDPDSSASGGTIGPDGKAAAVASARPDAQDKTPTLAALSQHEQEAPSVFQKQDSGLWDGRPSLGGIWVAYPQLRTPERARIQNLDTGRSVTGALFRRERSQSGPRFQVSSEAAEALGLVAGAPARLSVVALRRTPATGPAATTPPAASIAAAPAAALATTTARQTPPKGSAANPAAGQTAPAAADPKAEPAAAPLENNGQSRRARAKTPAAPSANPSPARGREAAVQVGIYGQEANALNARDKLVAAGLRATLTSSGTAERPLWSVTAEAAETASGAQAEALLRQVRAMGFRDAFLLAPATRRKTASSGPVSLAPAAAAPALVAQPAPRSATTTDSAAHSTITAPATTAASFAPTDPVTRRMHQDPSP